MAHSSHGSSDNDVAMSVGYEMAADDVVYDLAANVDYERPAYDVVDHVTGEVADKWVADDVVDIAIALIKNSIA